HPVEERDGALERKISGRDLEQRGAAALDRGERRGDLALLDHAEGMDPVAGALEIAPVPEHPTLQRLAVRHARSLTQPRFSDQHAEGQAAVSEALAGGG